MNFINESILEYSLKNSSEESELLKKLRKETNQKILHPRMLSGKLQGRLLSLISKLIKPKQILEIGTYTGYGTLCLSEGLDPNGTIHTIEINEELIDFQNKFFKQSDKKKQIKQYLGSALSIIEKLKGSFDIVFLDADKANYINYLELITPKLKKGGILITDNVLWSGKILDKTNKGDIDTQTIKKFNSLIKNHESFETILLPIRDGLSLSRKI
ncbi:MAG: O-methyltransferase [Candidatus Marivariicella sp.]|tara:strand:- start:917 stop:1558 length:642 start_codon:yes stop_codon:yes gene_type:complete